MSFQDFGSRSSSTSMSTPPSSRSASSVPSSVAMGQGALNQISESLLQYQRNVGILEKIVHSLTTASAKTSFRDKEELEMQYQAQADVITQLGEKVHNLLHSHRERTQKSSDPAIKTTLIKLERDFDRVQKQANALTSIVSRMKQQTTVNDENQLNVNGSGAYEQYQQQMQMQMQEDRLNEQIMREREDEIRTINRGMHQVNEIYKDLAHIVASQQDQVDAIETQMEDSRANADSGLKQIEKANEKYGSANCVIS